MVSWGGLFALFHHQRDLRVAADAQLSAGTR
jgi:hypothetical protein